MKKIFLLMMIVFLFISCDAATDYYWGTKVSGHELYYGDFGEIGTFQDAIDWAYDNIEYKAEEGTEIFQDPEETILLGTGDCEDFAILVLNILYVELGIEGYFVGVNSEDGTEYIETSEDGTMFDFVFPEILSRSVGIGGNANHAVVMVGDKIIDPRKCHNYSVDDIRYYYSTMEVFN